MRLAGVLLVGVTACGFSLEPVSGVTPDAAPDATGPGPDATPAAFDPARCPASFVEVTGQPYRYYWGPNLVTPGLPIRWATAQERCAAMTTNGGYAPHLVVFDSPGERNALWSAIGGSLAYQWVWTGLIKRPGGSYASIIGTPVAPEWAQLEPLDRSAATTTTKRAVAYGGNGGRPPGDLEIPLDWSLNAACECDGFDVVAMP